MPTRRRIVALAAGSAIAFPEFLRPAFSQNWPSHYLRLVVPLAPGGPTDIAARLVADPLSKIWSQQVVIENKPGGGTHVGSELVARSAPDGYTILYATSSLAVAPSLYKSLGYNPVTDFAP